MLPMRSVHSATASGDSPGNSGRVPKGRPTAKRDDLAQPAELGEELVAPGKVGGLVVCNDLAGGVANNSGGNEAATFLPGERPLETPSSTGAPAAKALAESTSGKAVTSEATRDWPTTLLS